MVVSAKLFSIFSYLSSVLSLWLTCWSSDEFNICWGLHSFSWTIEPSQIEAEDTELINALGRTGLLFEAIDMKVRPKFVLWALWRSKGNYLESTFCSLLLIIIIIWTIRLFRQNSKTLRSIRRNITFLFSLNHGDRCQLLIRREKHCFDRSAKIIIRKWQKQVNNPIGYWSRDWSGHMT